MEKVEKYVVGRVEAILQEIDSYENEARDNEQRARLLHAMIGRGESTDEEVKEFLSLEYTTQHDMQVLKTLLINLKSMKSLADTLSIEVKVAENHQEIFDHIKKDSPYLFTFKSGKKEFVSDDAKEAYEIGLERYLSKENIEVAKEQIKKQASVDNKQ